MHGADVRLRAVTAPPPSGERIRMQTRDPIVLDASTFAPRMDADLVDDPGQFVQFYQDETFLIDRVTRFIGAGLGAGDTSIVIATAPHREQLESLLGTRGLDLAGARRDGRYVPLDAAE